MWIVQMLFNIAFAMVLVGLAGYVSTLRNDVRQLKQGRRIWPESLAGWPPKLEKHHPAARPRTTWKGGSDA